MRVVSMVPSWTETLLEAGVEVVGRTRFCQHPADLAKTIPVVGGTKDWDWAKVRDLQPDLLVLDREENPRFMSEQNEISWWASHITMARDVGPAMHELSLVLGGNSRMLEWAGEWDAVLTGPGGAVGLSSLPGVIEWGKRPSGRIDKVVYVIWKNPWMCVARETFIGSVLERLGVVLQSNVTKYPEFSLADLDPSHTLLLFSSEPFPFLLRRPAEAAMFPHAYVDGEVFSWFGLRSLRFMKRVYSLERG